MGAVRSRIEAIYRERGALLMGVLNVTPDSFYDGGRYSSPEAAAQRIDALLEEGADVIDVGAESSRPGAQPVTADEQRRRSEFAVRHALSRGALVSIDTTEPAVAEFALGLGAQIVNDVSCLADPGLARVSARYAAALILMHSRAMSGMTGFSQYPEGAYTDVVEDVRSEWRRSRDRALAEGMPREDVFFDPGIGFAKSARHSYVLLSRLAEFQSEQVPIVVGASRKSFIGSVDGAPPEARLGGSVAAALSAAAQGATLLRVHDVGATRQALRVALRVRAEARERPHAG